MTTIYKAHINESTGQIQTVREHSEGTARLCEEFAVQPFKPIAAAMGMIHDVGKFQSVFQRRINNENIKVEHSTCGAIVSAKEYGPPASYIMEYCISGHHSGLPDSGDKNDDPGRVPSTMHSRMKRQFEDFSAYKSELDLVKPDEKQMKELISFLAADCKTNAQLIDKFAFITRYCFSCLVDADSIDTGRFCGTLNEDRPTADFRRCLDKVNERLDFFVCRTQLQKTRKLLQQQVFDKADKDAEIYLMNMPTGSGKTLCSVKFALERALRKNKKRIIYVIPYNSIIDQTAGEFEKLFGQDAQILRHQSSFSYEDVDDEDENYRTAMKTAAENWDAPFIITTAVQFFESLHSNKRGKLRKVHNIADSILIFDEAHLMPQKYLKPCLESIAYAARYLNSEAVFLTATMPDFEKLIKKYAVPGSAILDLVDDKSDFDKFDKCRFEYIGEVSGEELIAKSQGFLASLIIVNSKKRAKQIYRDCTGRKFHLSTYLTATDRKRIIDTIKEELHALETDNPDLACVPEERRITVVSTSLIEAGVDLDMCTVFRELTGLDSILQSGGRCNREGKRDDGSTYIFSFSDSRKVSSDERANLTRGLLRKYDNITSPECIREYYDRLFFMNSDHIEHYAMSNFCRGIDSIPFKTYAHGFRIIEDSTESIAVPSDENSRQLMDKLPYAGQNPDRVGGIGSISRKLQKYTCSVSREELRSLIEQGAVQDFDTGIWCLMNSDYYDKDEGIGFEPKDYII